MSIEDKFMNVRELYRDDPESIEQLEAEEERVHKLLKRKEYADNEETQVLLAMCRKEIVLARKRLATDRRLVIEEEAMRELWAIIDARLWFIKMVAIDYDGEIAKIEADLDKELQV